MVVFFFIPHRKSARKQQNNKCFAQPLFQDSQLVLLQGDLVYQQSLFNAQMI